MPKFSLRFALIAFASVVGIVFVLLLLIGQEPRFHGHPLSFWTAKLQVGTQRDEAEATEALHAMGKSAVPYLISALKKTDSPLRLKLMMYGSHLRILSKWLKPTSPLSRIQAAQALGEIGPSASNAIPALEACRTNFVEPIATAALMKIKEEPVAPLIQRLDVVGPDRPEWCETARVLAEFGTNARAVIPALCRGVASTNNTAVFGSAIALGRIHCDPEVALPALINALNHVSWPFNNIIIGAIGNFEGEAKPAVPALRKYLQDPNSWVRYRVLESLDRILPPEELDTLIPELTKLESDPTPAVRASANFLRKKMEAQVAAAKGK